MHKPRCAVARATAFEASARLRGSNSTGGAGETAAALRDLGVPFVRVVAQAGIARFCRCHASEGSLEESARFRTLVSHLWEGTPPFPDTDVIVLLRPIEALRTLQARRCCGPLGACERFERQECALSVSAAYSRLWASRWPLAPQASATERVLAFPLSSLGGPLPPELWS